MAAKEITIKVTVSKENVAAIIAAYKRRFQDYFDKEPSERWIRGFVRYMLEMETMDGGGTFTDDLDTFVSDYTEELNEDRRPAPLR